MFSFSVLSELITEHSKDVREEVTSKQMVSGQASPDRFRFSNVRLCHVSITFICLLPNHGHEVHIS